MSTPLTPPFLSEDWLAAYESRLASAEPFPSSEDAGSERARLALGQIVRLAAGGERCWTVILAAGERPRLLRDSVAEAEVVLVASEADSAALARGECSAADLLERGAVKIRGDARRLVSQSALLDALAALSPPGS